MANYLVYAYGNNNSNKIRLSEAINDDVDTNPETLLGSRGNFYGEDDYHVGVGFNNTTDEFGRTVDNSDLEIPLKLNDGIETEEFVLNTIYQYSNYYMSYRNIEDDVKTIHKREGMTPSPTGSIVDSQTIFKLNSEKYNRFKTVNIDEAFQKGFAHVFFVRPDCNIYSAEEGLSHQFDVDSTYKYAYHSNKYLLYQLSRSCGIDHDFMFSLSNKAASFSLQDEYINYDTYGKTYSGWKIAFGRNNVESKTAGQFTITYKDDKNFHIYHLHKLWVEYISGVYTGKYAPKTSNIINKTLDYVTAVYYIITAEDGETILFWSKYYGVFPVTIPSTQYAWSHGNLIGANTLDIDIEYHYSFKEDFNPSSLLELNENSKVSDPQGQKFIPVYNKDVGHVGTTWVGKPYIETVTDNNHHIEYKLRFVPSKDDDDFYENN